MTFIISLIALLIERFFDWSHLRRWSWYDSFQQFVSNRFPVKSPYLILIATIGPLLLAVAILQFALKGLLYGFITLLFELLILLYCLGPENLWADAFACINALQQGGVQFAAERLKKAFGIFEISSQIALQDQLLNGIFVAANRRVFAVLFWFVILGPVGAVLYRTITLSARDNEGSAVSVVARLIEAVLNWLPVRLFTFLFALGGHFVQVLSCWRKNVLTGLTHNEYLLTECGRAALGSEVYVPPGQNKMGFSPELAAMGLLDRVFVITLVIIAIVAWIV